MPKQRHYRCKNKITGSLKDRSQHQSDVLSDTEPSSSTAADNTPSPTILARVLEIPGFYYDDEKKRYFKIAPNHSTGTCNYTKDALEKKKAEAQRLHDVSEFVSKKTVHCSSYGFKNKNIVQVLERMTLMGYQKHEIRLKLLQNTITRLKPLDSAIVFNADLYSHMQANIDNMLCMHKSDSDAELLCLWSLKDSCAQRIQIVQLCEGKRAADTGSLCLSACPVHRPLLPMTHKVTAMCWAPRSGWQRLVLYTTMGHVFRQESMAVIRCLSENDTEHNQEYCLGRKATWSCAWNPVHNQMSVGSERCALLLNTDRRTMFEYNTNNSDPLAVAFSKQTGMTLYAGLRRGGILMFDLRCRSTIPMLTLHHKSSVCSVQPVYNDIHLLAADFSGIVCLWDTRTNKVLVDYHGHVNKYTSLPIHIDDTETIVYGVGEDGYTRFWQCRDGKQLLTLPPPSQVSRETIPCVQLSTRWGGQDGNSGLVMGLNNRLHYYGSLSVYS